MLEKNEKRMLIKTNKQKKPKKTQTSNQIHLISGLTAGQLHEDKDNN